MYTVTGFSAALMSVDKYLEYLEIHKNVSHYTLRNYRACLDRWTGFSGSRVINMGLVDEYRAFLRGINIGWNWSIFHLIVLKEYLKWATNHDYIKFPYWNLDIPKYQPVTINVQSRENLEKLFHIDHEKRLISLRNTAIVRTLYSTGCRVSELISMDRWLINESREFPIVGKGKKQRVVFLSLSAYKACLNYLKERKDSMPPLFISHSRQKINKRLTRETVEKIVRDYAKIANLTRTTPHSIRHTFATELLRNGVDIMHIKELLGHSSVRTTQIYLQVTNPELKKSHEKYHR